MKPNAELAWRVIDHIDAHPETWNQSTWHCGSSYCFGGWAVVMSGLVLNEEDYVVEGPDDLVGQDIEDAAHRVLRLEAEDAWQVTPRGGVAWLFSSENTREDLGRLVAEIFGPRPAWTAVDEQAWRDCAHRADYLTPAHHANECGYHRGEVDEWGQPVDDVPPNAGSAQ